MALSNPMVSRWRILTKSILKYDRRFLKGCSIESERDEDQMEQDLENKVDLELTPNRTPE